MKRLLLFSLLLVLVPAFVSADLTTDIDSYYAFDTGSGSVVVDSVGNVNGSITGATWDANGIIDDALDYDGSGDYVSLGNNYDLSGEFTFTGWFKLDTLGQEQYIFSKGDANSVAGDGFFSLNTNPSNQLRFAFHDGTSWVFNTYSTNTVSSGTWYFYAVTRDSSNNINLSVNLATWASTTGASGTTTTTENFLYGARHNSGASGDGDKSLYGLHDEGGIWSRALNSSEKAYLYASGSPTTDQQYPFAVTGSNPFSKVRVFDIYDNSSLSGLNVTWTGQGVTNITDGSGVATCSNCSGNLSYVVDGGSLYFNVSGTGVENSTTSVSVYGAFFNFSAFDLLGDPVSVFNISSGSQSNTSVSGSSYLYLKPDSNNTVDVSGAGFVDSSFTVFGGSRNITDFNLTGLFESNFTVNATDTLTGGAVNTFCANVSSLNFSLSDSACTTSGEVSFPLMFGDYTVVVNATGYALDSVNVTVENASQDYEYLLLPENSIFIYFFDELSGSTLNGTNVSVDFTSPSNTTFTNSSTSGEMIVRDLAVGTWSLEASSSGRTTRDYFVTVGARSTQVLDIYLAEANQTEITTFAVRSQVTSDIITGATFTMEHKVGSSWVVLDQCITDAFGDCRFDLIDGVEYRFVVEADGFSTKTGTFVRTLNSYTISLSAESSPFTTYLDDFSYSAVPTTSSLDSGLVTFNLSVSSPSGAIEYFSQVISYGNSTSSNNVTSSTSGGTITDSINLSSYSGEVLAVYTVKSTSFDDPFTFSRTFFVFSSTPTNNLTLSDFVDYYGVDGAGELGVATRGILVTVAAVVVAAPLALLFGSGAGVFAAVAIFGAAGLFGWLNWGLVVVVSVLSLGLLFLGRRGGL